MLVIALARPRLGTAEAVLRALVAALSARGAVRDSFLDAVLAREEASPTGVPLPEGAIALPHADPEHVLAPAVAVATPAEPVLFQQMGSPEVTLRVGLVVVLALPGREQSQGTLVRLLRALQRPGTLSGLRAADDDAVLAAAVESLWTS